MTFAFSQLAVTYKNCNYITSVADDRHRIIFPIPYRWGTRTETEPSFTELGPNPNPIFKVYTQNPKRTEPLSSENPNRTRIQNFGFFPISNWEAL